MLLKWALTFLLIAVLAALFGFGGIASNAAGIAQVLFFVFVFAFTLFLVMNAERDRAS